MHSSSIKKLNLKEFPKSLLEIPDKPKQLYIEGILPSTDENIFLTVVGSRRYSSYGREACEKLISELADLPVVIVSGLAIGIDAIAHQAAMKAGLLTVAVPGSGLDPKFLYPTQNRPLAKKILDSGGCLLSEFDPETHAGVYTFPRRNRIMAGLARATLIIEAGEKSGTLITARLAMEYNRDVLVVPGPIFSHNSNGSNELIKVGATPISSGQDLIRALGFNIEEVNEKVLANLSDREKKIVEIIKRESLSREELIEQSGLSITEANILLSTMEINGLIKESMGEIRVV